MTGQPAGRPHVFDHMDRRAFLRVAGVSAAGAVAAACGSGSPTSPIASTGVAPPETSVPPSSRPPTGPPNWDELRSQLAGGLLRPGGDGYDTAKRAFNPLFDSNNPVAVASAKAPRTCRPASRPPPGA